MRYAKASRAKPIAHHLVDTLILDCLDSVDHGVGAVALATIKNFFIPILDGTSRLLVGKGLSRYVDRVEITLQIIELLSLNATTGNPTAMMFSACGPLDFLNIVARDLTYRSLDRKSQARLDACCFSALKSATTHAEKMGADVCDLIPRFNLFVRLRPERGRAFEIAAQWLVDSWKNLERTLLIEFDNSPTNGDYSDSFLTVVQQFIPQIYSEEYNVNGVTAQLALDFYNTLLDTIESKNLAAANTIDLTIALQNSETEAFTRRVWERLSQRNREFISAGRTDLSTQYLSLISAQVASFDNLNPKKISKLFALLRFIECENEALRLGSAPKHLLETTSFTPVRAQRFRALPPVPMVNPSFEHCTLGLTIR